MYTDYIDISILAMVSGGGDDDGKEEKDAAGRGVGPIGY